MLKALKYPRLYILESFLWIPQLIGVYIFGSFIAATPVSSIDLHGKSLPLSWEAAVANHGAFLQGYVISNHPARFALSIILMIGASIAMYHVRKAQVWQWKTATSITTTQHTVANVTIMVSLLAVNYYLVTQVLVNVVPS